MFLKYSFKRSIILGLLLLMRVPYFRSCRPTEFFSSLSDIALYHWLRINLCNHCQSLCNTLGDPEGASRRLNFAQSFNGLGWILGPMIGGILLFASDGSLRSVSLPYLALGIVVFITAFIFSKISFPKVAETDTHQPAYQAKQTAPLWKQPLFIFGMVAQFLYVGAQNRNQ